MITIDELLKSVSEIVEKHDKEAKETGCDFNLLTVINKERTEDVHSKIITDLLNPNGTHAQGDVFLEKFFEIVLDEHYLKSNVRVDRELCIGKIRVCEETGKPKGGRIDIYIEADGRKIAVENKIDAGDQPDQLQRYHNYTKQIVYYLTPFGTPPKNARNLKQNEQYKIISYKEHILIWLIECEKSLITQKTLKTAICQYIDIVKKLTNQMVMDKEIKDQIYETEFSLYAAAKIVSKFNDTKDQIKVKLLFAVQKELESRLNKKIKEEHENFVDSSQDSNDAAVKDIQIKVEIHKNENFSIHWVAGVKHDFYSLFTIEIFKEETENKKYMNFLSGTKYTRKDKYESHILGLYGNQQELNFKELTKKTCSLVNEDKLNNISEQIVTDAIMAINDFLSQIK